MKQSTAALIACLTLAGCDDPSRPPSVTDPKGDVGDFRMQLLFEHEGCKTYRFTDAGRYVYYVRCKDGTSIEWDETIRNGKNRRTEEQGVNTR